MCSRDFDSHSEMAKEVSKKKEKKKKGRKTEEGSDEDDSNLSDEEVCLFLYP